MSLAQLISSRALWRAREVYRDRKHRFYHSQSKRPRKERDALARKWHKLWEEAHEQRVHRDRQIAKLRAADSGRWGGSRAVTNEVIRIVGGRAMGTSRKRAGNHPLSIANPGSDHNADNKTADAVDFATANNYALARDIARKLGGSWSGDYDSFIIRRNGKLFRVQIIAGTHGTGPHLHVGVRRS